MTEASPAFNPDLVSTRVDRGRSTYSQIVKSSALIGGASAANVAIGIVRTKMLALLLGPSGVGLLGLYGSVLDLAQTIAGMGVSGSGVRQISLAVSTGDLTSISKTVRAIKWTALVLAVVGALALLVMSDSIARFTFGTSANAGSIRLLGLALICSSVSAGQTALLQGMRRIGDVARIGVLGGLVGAALGIPLVWWYGATAVPAFLIAAAVGTVLTSGWYVRKVSYPRIPVPSKETLSEAIEILKLGIPLMASSLLGMGAAFLIRSLVVRKIGSEAAGFYQAAWALAGLYVGFILQAMAADFLPRLTAAVKDREEFNRIVNEQTEVGLLVAIPGVLATLALAPVVIHLFYSNRFTPAIEVLRWNSLGMLLRVAAWPMGFIMIAKNARKRFLLSESLCYSVYLLLTYVAINRVGLVGTGIAFLGLYVFCAVFVFFLVDQLSGFRFSRQNIRLAQLFSVPILLVFISQYFVPPIYTTLIGLIFAVGSGIYSVRTLIRAMPNSRLVRALGNLTNK